MKRKRLRFKFEREVVYGIVYSFLSFGINPIMIILATAFPSGLWLDIFMWVVKIYPFFYLAICCPMWIMVTKFCSDPMTFVAVNGLCYALWVILLVCGFANSSGGGSWGGIFWFLLWIVCMIAVVIITIVESLVQSAKSTYEDMK